MGRDTKAGRAEQAVTVEQAYRAGLRRGGSARDQDPGARPAAVSPSAVSPSAPGVLPTRPRVEPEPGILGLSRHARSRMGSRVFTLFFVGVFLLIFVQMIVALLQP